MNHLKLTAIVFILLSLGCSNKETGPEIPQPNNDTENETPLEANFSINLNDSLSNNVEDVLRPGTVAYGLLAADRYDNYFGLNEYGNATSGRGGYLKVDELSNLIRDISDPSELNAKLVEVDAAVSLAVSHGSKVELIFNCMVPDYLSKFQGYGHDVVGGENVPSGAPIFSCGPLKSDVTSQNTWFDIMKETAQYFSKYGDNVVFIIGNEPENYFAGNITEFLEIFELTATGLRAGNANVKIGGPTSAHYNEDKMAHSDPVYNAGSDKFTYSTEKLEKPIIELLLEHLNGIDLALNIIQTKKFSANPSPSSSGFWVKEHAIIEQWLQANPNSYNTNVELIYADFPGWHTVCAEDAQGDRESIWDSEYFSSWFVSTYLAMKSFSMEQTGIINNVEPLLSFLIEYGHDAFFHTSCEPDESKPAGFGGAIGLVTAKTNLPKPILNSLYLLTGLDGSIVKVDSEDINIQAMASYDSANSKVSVILSHFIPSELNYNPAGYMGYKYGTLFDNKLGFDLSLDDLKDITPNSVLLPYLSDPDYPKNIVHDLMADPAIIDLNALGLPDNFVEYLDATRTAGVNNRQVIEQSKLGIKKEIQFNLLALPAGEYTLTHQVVDKDHGNAYTHRHAINSDLEAANSSGGLPAVADRLVELRAQYGVDSTFLSEKTVTSTGVANVKVSLEPNSVHLLVLEKK